MGVAFFCLELPRVAEEARKGSPRTVDIRMAGIALCSVIESRFKGRW